LYKKPAWIAECSCGRIKVVVAWTNTTAAIRFPAAPLRFLSRVLSAALSKSDSSCNSQVTICWSVTFVTDIGIHDAVSDSSVTAIGNRRIAVRSRAKLGRQHIKTSAQSDVGIAEGGRVPLRFNGKNERQLESKQAVTILNRDKQGY